MMELCKTEANNGFSDLTIGGDLVYTLWTGSSWLLEGEVEMGLFFAQSQHRTPCETPLHASLAPLSQQ